MIDITDLVFQAVQDDFLCRGDKEHCQVNPTMLIASQNTHTSGSGASGGLGRGFGEANHMSDREHVTGASACPPALPEPETAKQLAPKMPTHSRLDQLMQRAVVGDSPS